MTPSPFEAIADAALEFEGKAAVLEGPDGQRIETLVLFTAATRSFNLQAHQLVDSSPKIAGRRSALHDARAEWIVTVDGQRWLVHGDPLDDGRVYVTLNLHGPVDDADPGTEDR